MDENNTPQQLATATPWNQLPNETDTAYHRFTVYLEMGADRSIPKVREKSGKSQGYDRHLYRWSSKYSWVDRCRAYDQHIALQYVENQELIQKKTRGKVLARMEDLVDRLYEIAEGEGTDRLDAIKLLLELGGMINQNEGSRPQQLPTYKQINNYFADK